MVDRVARQLFAEPSQRPVGGRLDGPGRNPQEPGDLQLGKILVVAQDHDGPLAGRQPPDRRSHHQQLLPLAAVGGLHPGLAAMADLQAKPAQPRPMAVDEHLAGIGLRVLLPAHQGHFQ